MSHRAGSVNDLHRHTGIIHLDLHIVMCVVFFYLLYGTPWSVSEWNLLGMVCVLDGSI